MAEWTERKSFYLKKEGLDKLHNANVLIVGLGGVGSLQLSFG
jgi:tRNA A37 threonylcarbamoyladenosine dehydratase